MVTCGDVRKPRPGITPYGFTLVCGNGRAIYPAERSETKKGGLVARPLRGIFGLTCKRYGT